MKFEATDGELVEVDTEKGELLLAWKDEEGETGIQRISFDPSKFSEKQIPWERLMSGKVKVILADGKMTNIETSD